MALAITGCTKEVPKCSDEGTLATAKDLFTEKVADFFADDEDLDVKIDPKEAKKFIHIDIKYPLASSYDEKIKKYTCEAQFINSKGSKIDVTYNSQLDDDGDHVITVNGISLADMEKMKDGVIADLKSAYGKKQKQPAAPEQSATPEQPAPAEAPVAAPPASPPDEPSAASGSSDSMITTSNINLRSCPGIQCNALAVIPLNSTVSVDMASMSNITERSGNQTPWVKINYIGQYCELSSFSQETGCMAWHSADSITGWVNYGRLTSPQN